MTYLGKPNNPDEIIEWDGTKFITASIIVSASEFNEWTDGGNRMVATASISIHSTGLYANQFGSNIYFFSSGSKYDNLKTSVFGGDVYVSGNMLIGTTHVLTGTTTTNTNNFIGGGVTNIVSASIQSSIIAGTANIVRDTSTNAVVGGGTTNIISASLQGSIVGGSTNTIKDVSTNSTIVGGFTNTISGAVRAVIAGGNSNSISTAASHAGIFAGSTNIIFSSQSTAIISGQNNTISDSCTDAIIAGGTQCAISRSTDGSILGSNTSGITGSAQASIIGGSSNIISGSIRGVILNGTTNTIILSNNASIVGSQAHIISASVEAAIIGGSTSVVKDISTNSGIFSSVTSLISGSVRATIVGGATNTISRTSTNSIIAGGTLNIISTSQNSAILGGTNNLINPNINKCIVLGSFLTASIGSSIYLGGTGFQTIISGGLTGSLQKTLDGNNYIIGSDNINVVTNSLQQIVISSSTKYIYSTAFKTSNYTVTTNDRFIYVSASNVVTMSLPTTATIGQSFIFKDYAGNCLSNIIVISSSNLNIDGFSTYDLNINYGSVEIVFMSSSITSGWGII